MVKDSLRDMRRWCGKGKEVVNKGLERGSLATNLASRLCIAIQPFLDEIYLLSEVYGGCAEGGTVEGCFFEANGSVEREVSTFFFN